MKKLIAMLLALVMVFSLVACGAKEEAPAETEAAAAPAETEAAAPAEAGRVYYLNFKPEFDAALQELAATYTAETGVEVKVVTAASGTYSDTLTAEMAKDEAPTLFQCGNAQGLIDWGDYALTLEGTGILEEQTTADFNLKDAEGKVTVVDAASEASRMTCNAFALI